MKERTSLIAACWVIALVFASLAVWQHTRSRSLETVRLRLLQRESVLNGRMNRRQNGPKGTTKEPVRPVSATGPTNLDRERQRRLQDLYAAYQLAQVRKREGPVLRKLQLSDQQADSLARLGADHDVALNRERLRMGQANETADEATWLAYQKKIGDQLEAAERTVLGDAKFQQYQELQQSIPLRELSDELAGNVYYSDNPLSADQADRFTALLQQNAMDSNGKVNGWALNWDAAIARAATVLTPSQLDTFKTVRDNSLLWQQVNQIRRSADSGASKPSG